MEGHAGGGVVSQTLSSLGADLTFSVSWSVARELLDGASDSQLGEDELIGIVLGVSVVLTALPRVIGAAASELSQLTPPWRWGAPAASKRRSSKEAASGRPDRARARRRAFGRPAGGDAGRGLGPAGLLRAVREHRAAHLHIARRPAARCQRAHATAAQIGAHPHAAQRGGLLSIPRVDGDGGPGGGAQGAMSTLGGRARVQRCASGRTQQHCGLDPAVPRRQRASVGVLSVTEARTAQIVRALSPPLPIFLHLLAL